MQHTKDSPSTQNGIALIAVLWVVAIMSMITLGLVQSVRSEVKVSHLDRMRVEAQAIGDAAITLAAQQLSQLRRENPNQATFDLDLNYAGQDVAVRIQGLNGLVSLNGAPVELLSLLFERVGGLAANHSNNLAIELVQWRESADANGKARGFSAPEDLLQVPGVDYALYARVARFVATSSLDSVLDPSSSPAEVQAMLGLDGSTIQHSAAVSPYFRFTAIVRREATSFEVIRDMRISEQATNNNGLYWITLWSQIQAVDSSS